MLPLFNFVSGGRKAISRVLLPITSGPWTPESAFGVLPPFPTAECEHPIRRVSVLPPLRDGRLLLLSTRYRNMGNVTVTDFQIIIDNPGDFIGGKHSGETANGRSCTGRHPTSQCARGSTSFLSAFTRPFPSSSRFRRNP